MNLKQAGLLVLLAVTVMPTYAFVAEAVVSTVLVAVSAYSGKRCYVEYQYANSGFNVVQKGQEIMNQLNDRDKTVLQQFQIDIERCMAQYGTTILWGVISATSLYIGLRMLAKIIKS